MDNNDHSILYLSQSHVVSLNVSMAKVIRVVEEALRAKGRGDVEMPPKPGIHPREDAFIHAMPAYLKSQDAAGIKWVSGYPQNASKGLPYITGLIVLNDADTGLPTCIMDAAWITGMRTGAASAVAAKHLARPDSSTLGILGCGVQGRTNLLALREVLPIDRVHVYDVREDAARNYATAMAETTGLTVEPVSTPEHAVRGMDVVVTAGPILREPHATIQADWLEPGAFACPFDFDSYWTREALQQTDGYFTDDLEQYRYYTRAGYFRNAPAVSADLGDVLTGSYTCKRDDRTRTICMNLGLALEDIAVAPVVFETAKASGTGIWLPL